MGDKLKRENFNTSDVQVNQAFCLTCVKKLGQPTLQREVAVREANFHSEQFSHVVKIFDSNSDPRKFLHTQLGMELVTMYQAVCIPCDKEIGELTEDQNEARRQANDHARLMTHETTIISSDD